MPELREGFEVVHADRRADPILRNLFEFYLHDMAEWFRFDQGPDGRYTQSTERYWDTGHEVYLLTASGIPIGFALVGPARDSPQTTDMVEFFVVRRHRREGVGREFAEHIWRIHPGNWLVRVYRKNEPALPFWRRTIAGYTGGDYVGETRPENGKSWAYFTFRSRSSQ